MSDDTGDHHGAIGFMGTQPLGGHHSEPLEFRPHEHRRVTIG